MTGRAFPVTVTGPLPGKRLYERLPPRWQKDNVLPILQARERPHPPSATEKAGLSEAAPAAEGFLGAPVSGDGLVAFGPLTARSAELLVHSTSKALASSPSTPQQVTLPRETRRPTGAGQAEAAKGHLLGGARRISPQDRLRREV
jgi:hypothetical protein